MLCEICKKNEATVHFKQVCNGEATETFICRDCAQEQGFDVQASTSMTDFLFGLAHSENTEERADVSCPSCHMRRSDFKKTSRLGCARCYEAFAEELESIIRNVQTGSRHKGKVPSAERLHAEIHNLTCALEEAVAAQEFEQAAELRDRIAALKSGGPSADAENRSESIAGR